MAFRARLCLDLSSLLDAVFFSCEVLYPKDGDTFASVYSYDSLSKYVDFDLPSAVVDIRRCVVSSHRTDAQRSTCFCHHHCYSHNFIALHCCRGLHFAVCGMCFVVALTEWPNMRIGCRVNFANQTKVLAKFQQGQTAAHLIENH